MKLPTIPYDKSLHMNYGAIIAAVVSIAAFLLLIVFAAHKGGRLSALLFAPLCGLVASLIGARVKEILDNRANRAAAAAGEAPPHSYEIADQKWTVMGGLVVAVPQAVMISALVWKGV